jgi:predicted nucleotidyltransferase
MGSTLDERRQFADGRFKALSDEILEAQGICKNKACVYATGSFGRREASKHSDIDLFIVSLHDEQNGKSVDRLTKLNEILVKAVLIRAATKLNFPPFSQDGRFLQHHMAKRLIDATGSQTDDYENTFTARLLLLLESRPLVGEAVHEDVINEVIAKYWREYSGHSDRFMPGFLANDILRYWRTLCLNYEASTIQTKPAELAPKERAKRKVKNYKLKHSRMLTCYSALLQLLSVYVTNGTVAVADVQELVHRTPTERVEFVRDNIAIKTVGSLIGDFLGKYEQFLENTSRSEDELIEIFKDDSQSKKLRSEQSQFGDLAYEILFAIGKDNPFYRRLVI